jgi:hypothetical protein
MLVLHANWTDGRLRIWGESLDAYLNSPRFGSADSATASDHSKSRGRSAATITQPKSTLGTAASHPFACPSEQLRRVLSQHEIAGDENLIDAPFRLRLPGDSSGPWPSDRLARRAGLVESPVDPTLGDHEVPAVALDATAALHALVALDEREPTSALEHSQSLRYWIAVAHFVIDLLQHQRFVPTISRVSGNGLRAAWQPWLDDEDARLRVGQLARAMPPAARAAIDRHHHQPLAILDDALRSLTDQAVRSALTAERFIEAIEDRDHTSDAHVAWLGGLLDWSEQVAAPRNGTTSIVQEAGEWIKRLVDRGQNRPLRLCLRLNEPAPNEDANPVWILSFHLQSPDHPQQLIDAAHIWDRGAPSAARNASLGDTQEILLAELGRASRVYDAIETALEDSHPTHVELNTVQAYEFLRDVRPVLEESGVAVIVPEWWDQPLGRLAVRLHIDAPAAAAFDTAAAGSAPASSMLGLNSIVKFRWQVAIGDEALTTEEFKALSSGPGGAPLVKVRGRWIEISPDQLSDASKFLEQGAGGEMTLLEAIQIAHGAGPHESRLPVQGMDATGWVADFLKASSSDAGSTTMPVLQQPRGFTGALRPYQVMGLSWLAFLDRFGLGACLADDMGLGKTIQLIALLLHERENSKSRPVDSSPGPTLLVVPTSVIENWVRELHRFAPLLKAHVQHGPDRPVGDQFAQIANGHDLVITTYPLVSRDIESLRRARWHRVALDEAQYIKNPPTKQTTAIRSLAAPHRLALTGTPVENRLSELWSIMEFCNPGYLGAAGEFRRRFGIPVERHHNRRQADRLRQMIRPFVLRRVKTDPKVIDDLPDITETKEYATLTVEQAALYQETVNAMLNQVDRAEGIQRRGLVLATLVKLKQICNHPAQARGVVAVDKAQINETEQHIERSAADAVNPAENEGLSARSGKARRLMVMLEEVIASGEKSLIFTQFRQMGHLLTTMIQHDLDCEALFLHGGTPANKRQQMIDRFQSDSGGVPIFVLSLKAGGLGLNLTAANHVFHFDRWWNPAVENQATDRAFRIGQMRAVQVHKFVCLGTLEERIDQMIEQKTDLARNIIGSGEQWLTELTTGQLHDLLMLRPSALEGES